MSEPTDKQQVDMALILEGRIKERVKEILEPMVERVVVNALGKELLRQWNENKQNMQLEIAIQLGKILRQAEEDGHKPLWHSKPEEFGLTTEELNTHNMGNMTPKDIDHAIQKQS